MSEQPDSAANVVSGVSESDVEALALNRFGVASAILKTVHLSGRFRGPGKRGAGPRPSAGLTVPRSDAAKERCPEIKGIIRSIPIGRCRNEILVYDAVAKFGFRVDLRHVD